jgi:hypothetical protein
MINAVLQLVFYYNACKNKRLSIELSIELILYFIELFNKFVIDEEKIMERTNL